jgi:hypothetical protein
MTKFPTEFIDDLVRRSVEQEILWICLLELLYQNNNTNTVFKVIYIY